jgi:hypothetical protein
VAIDMDQLVVLGMHADRRAGEALTAAPLA